MVILCTDIYKGTQTLTHGDLQKAYTHDSICYTELQDSYLSYTLPSVISIIVMIQT